MIIPTARRRGPIIKLTTNNDFIAISLWSVVFYCAQLTV
jgi:hypothetical protein